MGPRFHHEIFHDERTLMEERTGAVMAEMAILIVWCGAIIAGMILTLLMPVMFADSHAKKEAQVEPACVTLQNVLHVEVQNVPSIGADAGVA